MIALSGASHATLLVSISTSFNGFDREPGLDGLDEMQIARDQLHAAGTRTFDSLRERHVGDFGSYFNRVAIDVGEDPVPGLATDERLRRYTEGAPDPYLEALYFQFGRYLLISSSRSMYLFCVTTGKPMGTTPSGSEGYKAICDNRRKRISKFARRSLAISP